MRQFQVPQFITIEDKVIGPFTIKQFLYLAAGAGIIGLTYFFFQPFVYIPTALLIGTLAGSLAFLKINEQPFPVILRHSIAYLLRPRLYVWRKEKQKKTGASAPKNSETPLLSVPKTSQSKLTDLAWSLDIEKRLRE